MSTPSSEPNASLSIRVARLVDERCDQFEEQWKQGTAPRIEEFLTDLSDSTRLRLLEELLLLDVFFRVRAGEAPAVADYVARFPELTAAALEKIIHRGTGRPQRSSTPGDQSTVAHQSGDNTRTAGPRLRYFGDYELLEQIARGGMGVVYKARQISLNRLVAVKMILSGQFASEAQVKRFYSEAESAAQLDHPNIVAIYEVGEHEGDHYFSMALVEGTSLATQLAAGPSEPRQAAEVVQQVALAIEYAHSKGVIHRDLKPSNILLDAHGRPRITDFGLAKRVSDADGLTMTGDVLGTPSYMPPEQAAGKIDAVGPASDVYALGAVLYALLSGRPPFQAASSHATLTQVVEQEPVRLRQLNAAIPRDLETITQKCLEKSVAKRYTSAAALAHDLDNFLAGRPIQARPTSSAERAWRWCRRNPVVSSLSGLAILLLCSTAAVATMAYSREAKLRGDLELKSNDLMLKTTDLSQALVRESRLKDDAVELGIEQGKLKTAALAQAQIERDLRLAAEQQSRNLQALRLTADARRAFPEAPQQALLLAAEAVQQNLRAGERPQVPSEQALVEMLQEYRARPHELPIERGGIPYKMSPDGHWMFSLGKQELFLWDRRQFSPWYLPLRISLPANCTDWRFASGGLWLIGRERRSKLQLISLSNPFSVRQVANRSDDKISNDGAAISPDGRWYAVIDDSDLFLSDLDKPNQAPQRLTIRIKDFKAITFNPTSQFLVAIVEDRDREVMRVQLEASPPRLQSWLVPAKERKNSRASVSNDGRWLIWNDGDGWDELYDLQGEQPQRATTPAAAMMQQKGETFTPELVRIIPSKLDYFSPDSRYVWASSPDKIYLFDLLDNERKPLLESSGRRADGYYFASRFGNGFAVAGTGGQAKLLRLPLKSATPEPIVVPDDWENLQDARCTAAGDQLVTLSRQGLIRKWDLRSPVNVAQTNRLSVPLPGPAKVTDEARSARLLYEHRCAGVAGASLLGVAADGEWAWIRDKPVTGWRSDQSGLRMIMGERDQLLHLRAMRKEITNATMPNGQIGNELGQGHRQIALSGNERWLLLMGKEDFVWDLQHAGVRVTPHVLKSPTKNVVSLLPSPGVHNVPSPTRLGIFSQSGQWLASSLFGVSEVRLNRCTGEPVEWKEVMLPCEHSVTALAFSPDEKFLAVGTAGGTIQLVELAAPEKPRQTQTPKQSISALQFSPDSKQLLSVATVGWGIASLGQVTEQVCLWQIDQPSPWENPKSCEVQTTLSFDPRRALFSADGRWIVVASGKTIQLFDRPRFPKNPRTLAPIASANYSNDGLLNVHFTPDSKLLAASTRYGTPTVWNLLDEQLLPIALTGLEGDRASIGSLQVVGLQLTAEGTRLIALLSDGSLRLWNLAGTPTDQLPLRIAVSRPIVSLASRSSQQELVLLDNQGDLHSIALDPQRLIEQAHAAAGRDLSEAERKNFACPVATTMQTNSAPQLPALIAPQPNTDPSLFSRRFELERDFEHNGQGLQESGLIFLNYQAGVSSANLKLLGLGSSGDSFATFKLRSAAGPGGVFPPSLQVMDADAAKQLSGGQFTKSHVNPLMGEQAFNFEGAIVLPFRAQGTKQVDIVLKKGLQTSCLADAVEISTPLQDLLNWELRYHESQAEMDEPPSPETAFQTKLIDWSKERLLNLQWHDDSADSTVPAKHFALSATTPIQVYGRLKFRAIASGPLRVLLDDRVIIDQWKQVDQPADYSAESELSAGDHKLRVEFYHSTGKGHLKLGIDKK